MKRTDINPGVEYLAASGRDAINGGGYNRRKVIVLSTTPHARTRDRAAVAEQRDWRGNVTAATEAVPAATATFDGPEGPVTVKAKPDPKGDLPALVWRPNVLEGAPVWDFAFVSSREVVDTWEHAEQVVADGRRCREEYQQAVDARKIADRARFDALAERLAAVDVENPVALSYGGLLETRQAAVATALEALLDRLDAARQDA